MTTSIVAMGMRQQGYYFVVGGELGIVNVAYLLGIDSSWRRWVEKRNNHPRDGKKTSQEIWDEATE